MSLYYIGSFPPEYGGVTIKNQNLYQALLEKTKINKIDLNKIKRKNYTELVKFLFAVLTPGNHMIIGISGRKNRWLITKFLYLCSRNNMKNSILILMGGALADDIQKKKNYKKYLSVYRKIYVETNSLDLRLKMMSLSNTAIYPNCRFRPEKLLDIKEPRERLQCLFFSLIRAEKGVDLILIAAQQLPQVDFHFFGNIIEEYKVEFLTHVNRLGNVFYHGVFNEEQHKIFERLNQFDVLLLPTRWEAEGVPGVLIEGKIAGIAEIVTNHNYNKEIVENGISGIVLKQNNADHLVEAIRLLAEDKILLMNMKYESRESAEKYYIEHYISGLLEEITNE